MAKLTSISIDESGGPYSTAPTIEIGLPNTDSATVEASANIINGKITSVDVYQGGTYYSAADSNVSFVLPAEPTKRAKLSASLSDNAISSLSIDSGGSYYISAPSLVFDAPDGTATQSTASVFVDSSGLVQSVNIVDSGLYYTIVPIARLNYYIGDSSFFTTLDVTIANSKVSSLEIQAGDGILSTNIDSADVSIDAPTGNSTDFIATATTSLTDNRVGGYQIVYPGAGYTTPPNISVEIPTGVPSQFEAAAQLVVVDGVVTAITITDSGNFYESDQTTVDVAFGSLSANDFRATAVCTIDSAGSVNSVTITDSGNFYTSAPSVSFQRPAGIPPFNTGENVTQTLSDGVIIRGEVANWNDSSYTVDLIHVGADDGNYHEFTVGGLLVGELSSSQGTISSIVEDNQLSADEQNDDFSTESADFLDFTESNPFGDPS